MLRIAMAFSNAKYTEVQAFSEDVDRVLEPLEIHVKKY